MPKFAANLTYLFNELPLLDRFAAAAAAGFKGVEIQLPYEFPAVEIKRRLTEHGLEPVLYNLPSGSISGDRGLAAMPGREADFWGTFEQAFDYAVQTGCKQLHVLSGNRPAGQDDVLVANLQRASAHAANDGVTLLIEPLNAQDNPTYFLNRSEHALSVLDRVGRDNVKLQLDLYHYQISEGNLAGHIRRLSGRYAHVQIANPPGRNEPGAGEISFPFLFDLLDSVGYKGWIGCEYKPSTNTAASLAWARPWGIRAA